jgi:hypothetical protein
MGLRTLVSNKCSSNPLLPYNYSNSWDRQERKNTLNNNISLSAGKKNVGANSTISAFLQLV